MDGHSRFARYELCLWEKYNFGKYLIFSLRIDRKIIPPALFRLKYLQAEKAFLVQWAVKKVYRAQWDKLREAVRTDLLKKVQPIPSFFESFQQGKRQFSQSLH
jgi:hypothetical protein